MARNIFWKNKNIKFENNEGTVRGILFEAIKACSEHYEAEYKEVYDAWKLLEKDHVIVCDKAEKWEQENQKLKELLGKVIDRLNYIEYLQDGLGEADADLRKQIQEVIKWKDF